MSEVTDRITKDIPVNARKALGHDDKLFVFDSYHRVQFGNEVFWGTPLSIRELDKDDLDSLLELYGYLHQTDLPRPERKEIENVWAQALGSDNIRYFGYFVSSGLISSCTVTVIPNLTRACRPYALIENVVTHGDFRKQGYGKAVLHAALDFAWGKNCYKVMLMTGRLDEGTYAFYESVGFRRDKKQAFVIEQNSPY